VDERENGTGATKRGRADALGVRLALLADPDARLLVDELAGARGESLSVRGLAERVAGPDGRTHEVDALRVKLHHVSLPRLAEMGAVRYDLEDCRVVYRGDDLLERCLSAIETVDP
jgi:hypothetical protein